VWPLLLLVFTLVLPGTAAASAAPAAPAHRADLTIEASTGNATSVLVFSEATLRCDGAANGTGFLRRAAGPACAAVHRGVLDRLAARQRAPRICTEGYAGPQSGRVSGTVDGQRVDVQVARTDGCGSNDWQTLVALLGQPERIGNVPARAQPAPTTTSAPAVAYVVKPGDTLTSIAREFDTSVAAITSRNQLDDPDNLTEGQSLTIPPPSPARIVVKLHGSSGFDLTLIGAQSMESVTFGIESNGTTYTGPPHVASPYGVVTTTYETVVGASVYTIVATGALGTVAQLDFHVDPGRP
jgi:LysM repeat protein